MWIIGATPERSQNKTEVGPQGLCSRARQMELAVVREQVLYKTGPLKKWLVGWDKIDKRDAPYPSFN
jgi:hypothetical protein